MVVEEEIERGEGSWPVHFDASIPAIEWIMFAVDAVLAAQVALFSDLKNQVPKAITFIQVIIPYSFAIDPAWRG